MDLEVENGQNVLSVESDGLPMDFQWTFNGLNKIHQLLVMYTYYIYISIHLLINITIATIIFFVFFFLYPHNNFSGVKRKHCMYKPVIVLSCHSFENRVKTSKPCIELLTGLLSVYYQ